MDVKVSVSRLKKAMSLWWRVDWQHQFKPSQLLQTEQSSILLSILCELFPEILGKRVGDRWYAAGHRIRGAELKAVSGECSAFMFNARPQQWPKKADAGMPHLKPLFCIPIPMSLHMDREDVVIVSDSTLNLPGFMYGIACGLRKHNLNLLWLVTKSGGGAQELQDAWAGAPQCHWGLSVLNLNDALRHEPWSLSDEDHEHLAGLLRTAGSQCSKRHDLFVNNAMFFPKLRPSVYPALVKHASAVAEELGVRVHDGREYVETVKLRDNMHFAAESSESVAAMYVAAIVHMCKGVEVRHEAEVPRMRSPPLGANEHTKHGAAEEEQETAKVSARLNRGCSGASVGHEADSDEYAIKSFLHDVSSVQRRYKQPVRAPACITPSSRLPSRLPPMLPDEDNRFGMKSSRVFVCDGCGNVVRFSGQKRQTAYQRIHCDFAGSYYDSSWADIPGVLQRRAWEERLIDATWFCTQFCHAPMTGVNTEQRLARAEAWRQSGGSARQRQRCS